jgi:ankyrin repeat protein
MRFPRPFLLPLALFMSACGHFGEESFPPLIAAARGGDAAAIRALIRQGADPNLRAGHHPWPALMHAVHTNRPQAVLALLDEGADPNGATPTGITVLMMAAGYGRAAMVRELLRRGADPRRTSPGGVSALSTAVGGVPDIDRFTAGQCQTDTVRSLLEAAPDLKLPDTLNGKLARLAARAGGCSEVLAMLDGRVGAGR